VKKFLRILIWGFFSVSLTFSLTECGVKGDPVPPMTPAEIGHGRPLYKTEDEMTPQLTKPRHNPDQKDGQDGEDNQ
jgi:hypothetical protein